jgi:hypothetical protein
MHIQRSWGKGPGCPAKASEPFRPGRRAHKVSMVAKDRSLSGNKGKCYAQVVYKEPPHASTSRLFMYVLASGYWAAVLGLLRQLKLCVTMSPKRDYRSLTRLDRTRIKMVASAARKWGCGSRMLMECSRCLGPAEGDALLFEYLGGG